MVVRDTGGNFCCIDLQRPCDYCDRRILIASNRLVQQQRLSDILDFRDGAFQIEGFGEDDLEDLLYVDAVAGTAEDETGAHCFGESSGLCSAVSFGFEQIAE